MKRKLLNLILIAIATNTLAEESVPVQHAQKYEFNTCQSLVKGLSTHTINGNPHGALSTWNKNGADPRLFQSIIPIKYTDGNSVAVINAVNTKSGNCDGSYVTIFYNPKSCSAARETTFKTWKYVGELSGLPILENESGAVSKILMPAGAGCISINTEVAYD